jgi:predicted RNA-binding protein YlxR (DUF448 family)
MLPGKPLRKRWRPRPIEVSSPVPGAHAPKTHAEASRQRRDIASGEVMEEARLIRFVAGPDGTVVPDLGRDLPGRGLWVEATRSALDLAIKRQAFSRAAKTKLAASPDLADQVEQLLHRRALHRLGLARKAGALTSGFEKTAAALRAGQVAWLIEASDGSADGRDKLLALLRHQSGPARVCGVFSGDELSLALGLGHAIHSALLAGRWSQRWSEEIGRLAGFRPLQPEGWSPPEPSGGAA